MGRKNSANKIQNIQTIDIKIGSLNINGSLSKKLDFLEVKNFIQNTDICAIQESWMLPGEELYFPSYKHFKNIRKPKNKSKRGSGGLVVLYKNELDKGITREKSSDEKNTIWIKLDKDFFNLKEHLFLATAYFPPQGSTYLDDPDDIFSKFEKDVAKFSNFGDVCVICDLNARISVFFEDFIIEDFNLMSQNDDFSENIRISLKKRISEDPKKNKRGRKIDKRKQTCSSQWS